MAFIPRPVSPRSAGNDLWAYLTEKRAHKWPLLGVSAALTWVLIWAFMVDAKDISQPQRNKITYFQSWNSGRSETQAILQQKLDVEDYEVSLRKRQQQMQRLADMFGIEWREDAARNDARRAEALKKLRADLDRRLAEAEAREGAVAAETGIPVPIIRLPARAVGAETDTSEITPPSSLAAESAAPRPSAPTPRTAPSGPQQQQ